MTFVNNVETSGIRRITSGPNVLFVAPSFGASGGEIHALECIARWCSYGSFKEIHVITTKKGAEVLRSRGLHRVKTHVIPLIPKSQHHFFSSGLFTSFLVKTVLSIVVLFDLVRKKVRPDIVISVSHFMHDLLPATMVARLTRSSLIVYVHHLHPSPSERSKYHPTLLSLLAWINDLLSIQMIKHFADKVMSLSSMVKSQCVKLGIQKHKIAIAMNGINIEYISKIPEHESRYDACFLGRIYPLKGIFDLVTIWKGACSTFPDAKLAIIGEGARKYEDMLREKIEMNGLLGNVILKGYLPEDEKYSSLKSSSIFVFPSYEEGWGITICEAMACGLPVVAYDLPAYKVFKDAILKVPCGDKVAFTEKVLQLLSDHNLRVQMSRKARSVVGQFDWHKVLEEEIKTLGKHLA